MHSILLKKPRNGLAFRSVEIRELKEVELLWKASSLIGKRVCREPSLEDSEDDEDGAKIDCEGSDDEEWVSRP